MDDSDLQIVSILLNTIRVDEIWLISLWLYKPDFGRLIKLTILTTTTITR